MTQPMNDQPLGGAPLRVRGIEPVRLHADLNILAKRACTPHGREPVGLSPQEIVPNNLVGGTDEDALRGEAEPIRME
jgi:hypothetical protein